MAAAAIAQSRWVPAGAGTTIHVLTRGFASGGRPNARRIDGFIANMFMELASSQKALDAPSRCGQNAAGFAPRRVGNAIISFRSRLQSRLYRQQPATAI